MFYITASSHDAYVSYDSPFTPHNMANLLVIVFLIQLLIHLINTIGATAINDLVSRSLLSL